MKKRSRTAAWAVAVVLVCALILPAAASFTMAADLSADARENTLRSAAQVVSSEITNMIIRPVTVSKVMSEDVNLREYLKEAGEDPESMEPTLAEYLSALRDGLGYKMMFAVCEQSGAYYTCDGISSYIDRSYEGNSEWYGAFLASGKEQDLDVDIEQSTGWALSVFTNQLVRDEQGNILGVCGTAVEMTRLQTMLEDYERIYQADIQVTDADGLIQIDTDEAKIETEYVTLPDIETISDGEYYYEKQGDRVVTYMKDADMYLVVTNEQSAISGLLSYVRIPMLCAGAGILISLALMGYALYADIKAMKKSGE